MEKAVAYLKNIRQEKGVSVEEVSKNTKISPSVIRALEEGRLDSIDQVYLKGFLKLYCRFLGVDWENFLKEYPAISNIKHSRKALIPGRAKTSASKKTASVSSIIYNNKKMIVIVLSIVIVLLMLILLFKGCVAVTKKIPLANLKRQTEASPLLRQAKTKNQAQAKAKNILSQPPQARIPEEAVARPVRAGVLLKEDSFIKVSLDGQQVYQGVLRKGKQENWKAKDRIELSVGNAGGVELEVNDKRYSPLGRRGQAVKKITIDREGLKISQ